MINFTITETIILAGILQAAVLIVAFGKKPKTSSKDTYFYLLIIFSTVMLLARLLAFKMETSFVYRFAMFADVSIFLIGPISYYYLRNQFEENVKVPIFHFLPALFHFIFFCCTCMLSDISLATYYKAGTLPFIFFLIESAGLFSMGAYLIFSTIQLRHRLLASQNYSVLALIAAWILIEIAWAAGYVDTYFISVPLKVLNYNLIWITIPIWIHSIGYYKLISNGVKVSKMKSVVSRVKREKQEFIVRKLEEISENNALFLDADLKLDDLAKEVNSSPNDLSWVLNEVYKMSFYEFINKARLNAFIDKVNQQEHRKKTLLALSYEVGFKSKSTFNNAFKTVYNQTPSQYISNNLN